MRNVKLSITDSTGSTISIAKNSNREELIIRNGTLSDRVYLAFNESAVDDQGIFLDAGDALVLTGGVGNRSSSNVYMVCASGETASVYADITA